ncbi:hypothetical protein D9Q98_010531 [Chlorella vulgaris]|uniref:Protein kinase domain-containing protein n=1 Tax=Chlorella vulgaris TaxID=3077 RepID=A0A9D4YXW4_CHLVU|nr:hypothetical protein D9Q98_010531 [Chlorella vulgaris]
MGCCTSLPASKLAASKGAGKGPAGSAAAPPVSVAADRLPVVEPAAAAAALPLTSGASVPPLSWRHPAWAQHSSPPLPQRPSLQEPSLSLELQRAGGIDAQAPLRHVRHPSLPRAVDGDGPEAIRHQFLGGGIPSGDLSRPRMPATPSAPDLPAYLGARPFTASSAGSTRTSCSTESGMRRLSDVSCLTRGSSFTHSTGGSGVQQPQPQDWVLPEELRGLTLGPMVGSGSFGRVFKGSWQSSTVAVKVLSTWVDPQSAESQTPLLEALLSTTLIHPNVVQTFNHALKVIDPAAQGQECWKGHEFEDELLLVHEPIVRTADKLQQQTWILQQYCDRGTLGDAIARGWPRNQRTRGGLDAIAAILATAQEIAAAMRYCHEQGVLHGDLTAGNVMLMGQPAAGPGQRDFTAKVGDFGLARIMDPGQHQLLTRTCGTIGYMPLERIQDSLLTKATDVYSFGVLCWEMLLGQRAWAGRQPVQILYARTTLKMQLAVPESVRCPPAFKALVEGCLNEDYKQRPSFDDIWSELGALLAAEQCAPAAAVAAT